MIEILRDRDLMRLRRMALATQGLLQVQPFGSGLAGARKAINHLGYVQLDTISVVERAHHHVFHSRVSGFVPGMTNKLLIGGDVFEYWAHAAALLPMDDFRFSLPYKHALKNGQTHWYKSPDRKLMGELLARVCSEGPLRSRDLESAGKSKGAGWWDWKPAKKALEQLYMEGDLMVSDREGFRKTYDLTERVLPSSVNTEMPTYEEFAEHLVDQHLRCHGVISVKGLTYLRRSAELRNAVKVLVNQRLTDGRLTQVQLSSGEVFMIEAGALERPLPRLSNRMVILSPFDNSVIQRDRLKALFGFDYQLECYLPEAKRRYGYFSLPLLYRDSFVGRMDCKAHRKTGELEIKLLHFNEHAFDVESVIDAFVKTVKRFSRFQNCASIKLTGVYPQNLLQPIRDALNRSEI